MIVFKITYDTSVVADFAPTFNNGWGYDYTTKTSTSGTLKTVTYESDTAFTSISIPNSNRNCVKSIYVDVSGVTNLYGTFTGCQSMTDFTIVNATSKLTNLYQITYDCTILANITYENCDLSSVTNIQNVFNGGPKDAVTNATFKNVKFNDTTKSMISILGKATTMVVEDCDFSSITSCYSLFGGCVGLKGTFDLSMHDFTNVYETNAMFSGCTNLTKIIMPKGTFDKITNCSGMFQNCTSLVEIDLSGFRIPNAQNISYMFSGCTSIEEIDCSALGVLNPTNINHMFISCQKLKRVNLSGIKVPKSISFSHMFYESTVVEWIDISNVLTRANDEQNFWGSGTVVKNIGMLYCPANVINAFANSMVNNGNICNIYYHDAKLEDLTVDSRFNYIYCEEYHGDTVTTPDDLKLYGLSDVQDTLDLTTGTYTQRVKKWNLAEEGFKLTDTNQSQVSNGYIIFYIRQPQFDTLGNPVCISKKGTHINNIGLPNLGEGSGINYNGRCLGVAGNNSFLILKLETTDVTSYDKAGLDEWIKANNFTVYYNAVFNGIDSSIKTETYQVNINPLKSYHNGSIQTSSQQLTPTLKTTLPISNKFTTTNLTSGSTYNVYFDGTATKLDAGGTIISNPVSPCEVECGGTTLTIEGTDIQNVRVIETSVKNEVGGVCGTTDVELNKVITSKYENLAQKITFHEDSNSTTKVHEDGSFNVVASSSSPYWSNGKVKTGIINPKGINLYHVEFDVDFPTSNLFAKFQFGINGLVPLTQYNFRELKLNNDTASICQSQEQSGKGFTTYISQGHFSKLIYSNGNDDEIIVGIGVGTSICGSYYVLNDTNTKEGSIDGYTPCTTQGVTISNFKVRLLETNSNITDFSQVTSSLRTDNGLTVIWQDMNMSMPRIISTLEQPIKLRSLGTTYDSYNPVTGELTKRIGVSETDGSYSVLSSPIVSQVEIDNIPHLYTNGQVKVYSNSKVYPTTILNGQSTNNYEVNELNTSNNYTIRYEGECESINLANKSNEQGTNRIVKSGTNGSGNLTFVNDNGDIDNVLLVQNDVREQEINHFNGLQTVEINQLFISNKQNLFEAYMKNDFEFLNGIFWGAQAYGSLHNGVFKCGNLSAGDNFQWEWCLIKPYVDNMYSTSKPKEDNPIVLANKVYNISFNISIVDHHTVDGGHNYNIRAYDFDGNEVSVQKATGEIAYLNIVSNGVTNPTPKGHINQNVIFNKDVYCFTLHADHGGAWAFDCTITDFTICEPDKAKPELPLEYKYIDLPQPVQLNKIHKENTGYSQWYSPLSQYVDMASGTVYDSYNPITGEYVQRVHRVVLDGEGDINYIDSWSGTMYCIDDNSLPFPRKRPYVDTIGRYAGLIDIGGVPYPNYQGFKNTEVMVGWLNNNNIGINLPRQYTNNVFSKNALKTWLRENPITLYYELETPIVTQLSPIEIPTFEGGILQLITTDGKVFPMVEYSMPTNNRYDTSSWEAGKVYTQRNMTEAYFNESTTPMTPTETMTLTTDHISSGSIILNDNGNGLIVLKGNYTGRDIPYFTGMRSVEAIEVETTPSPYQPLFGKGGRK